MTVHKEIKVTRFGKFLIKIDKIMAKKLEQPLKKKGVLFLNAKWSEP